jgi:hypothetical protein
MKQKPKPSPIQHQHKIKDGLTTPSFLTHSELHNAIETSTIFPKDVPVKSDIGKYGLMWPRAMALTHDAAKLLNQYSTDGCPTDCGPNWTHHHIITAIKRGPHISAKIPEASECLIKETNDKITGGYAKVVTWKDIKNNIPPNLKISPIAMIPHKSRKFRAILDLSFQMRIKGKKMPSVNSATNIKAPQKSMAELGNVLKRIVHTMASNHDINQPFVFSKCDIKDGFWRMVVNHHDAWNFCYVLPCKNKKNNIDNVQIVVPHSLQMGWCESPPFFCAATETGRDIIDKMLKTYNDIPFHPMEHYVMTGSPDDPDHHNPTTTNLVEVFVDDFIGVTNNINSQHLRRFARSLLHGIHCIFPPPSVSGHKGGDPLSESKMKQGDGQWKFSKEVLGWIFNGKNFTIELPPKKITKIEALLKAIIKRPDSSLKRYQEMAGKLQHASFGMPAGKGLFSPIYNEMKNDPDTIKITPELKQALQDWITILRRIGSRPTSVLELTPGPPAYIGYVDASGFGAGGVWISGTHNITPTVWRIPFPPDVEKRLVSDSNPTGDITNSDLEMAGVLLQWLILEQITTESLQHKHVGIFSDNTPTVAWASRLHSSKSKIAGHLLRALAIRQHINRVSPLTTISIAGEDNNMADIASRSFRKQPFTTSHLPFSQLFTNLFPLPQQACWKECLLAEKLRWRVISCLRGEPLIMASWLKIPKGGKNTGVTGSNIAKHTINTHTSQTAPPLNKLSSSQPSLLGSGLATTAKERLSKFSQSKTHSQPFPRQSSWLDNRPQSTKQRRHTKSQWHGWSKASDAKTLQQSPKLQSPLQCQPKPSKQPKHHHAPKDKR